MGAFNAAHLPFSRDVIMIVPRPSLAAHRCPVQVCEACQPMPSRHRAETPRRRTGDVVFGTDGKHTV